jgi:hypothetical protein
MRKTFFPAALLLVAALAAIGCGSSRTASLSGKVTYRGKAVTSGLVTVISRDGTAVGSGPIQPDGSFTIARAPTGAVKVAVDNPVPPGLTRDGMVVPPGMSANDPEIKAAREQARTFVPIPPRYADPNQSGLIATIKGGKNELPLDLQ